MTVYIVGVVLSVLLCSIAKRVKKHKNIVAFLASLPLGLISGFRWYVGTDFQSYLYAFTSIANGGTYGFEPLIVKISYFCSVVFKNVQVSFLVFSLLTIFLFTRTILLESEIPELSIFLFFTLGYYFSSMNTVRQYVAIAILFSACKFIWERKLKLFLLCAIIAAGFHTSAIAACIILIFCGIKFSKKQYIGIAICSVVASMGIPWIEKLIKIVFPQYGYVIERNVEALTYQEIFYYTVILLPCVVIGIIGYLNIEKNLKNIFLFNCVYFSMLMYLFLNEIPLLNRLAIYCEISVILFVPMIVHFFEKKHRRFIAFLIFVLTFCAFFVSIFSVNRYNVFPYQFNLII